MNTNFDIEQLKFPIGGFQKPNLISEEDLKNWIATIENFPSRIKKTTKGLSLEHLNLIYRPDGWSIKQVIHHCADSHMNCLIRCKLALTEDNPIIKPYDEAKWALLVDGNDDNIEASMLIIEGVHKRLAILLKSFDESHLKRSYFHPGSRITYQLKDVIALYAWHSNHHLAHIEQALLYKGMFK
jgi:hypothetical protein